MVTMMVIGNVESQKIFPSEELYLIKVAQFIWLQ